PDGGIVVCVDEMGPESAKSFAGAHLVEVTTRPAKRARPSEPGQASPAKRARLEIDYGRRGKGYVFGAFQPASGTALTWTAARRTTANFVAFLLIPVQRAKGGSHIRRYSRG